jgi:hypothetical protein
MLRTHYLDNDDGDYLLILRRKRCPVELAVDYKLIHLELLHLFDRRQLHTLVFFGRSLLRADETSAISRAAQALDQILEYIV